MKHILIFIFISFFISCKTKKETPIITEPTKIDSISECFDDILASDKKEVISKLYMMESESIKLVEVGGFGSGHAHASFSSTHLSQSNETNSIKCYSSAPLQKLTGVVVYNIPKAMKVRETYQVTVRIGKDNIRISENMGGEVVEAVIPITETMEVKLIDPSPSDHKSFEIVPDNEGVQMVDTTGEYTQWSWNVTPIKVGKASLKIVVSIIKNGNKKEEVYSDNVVVEANAVNQITFFFHKYWQWMLGTLLIPIFKYFWGIWRKKDEDNKPKKAKARKKA